MLLYPLTRRHYGVVRGVVGVNIVVRCVTVPYLLPQTRGLVGGGGASPHLLRAAPPCPLSAWRPRLASPAPIGTTAAVVPVDSVIEVARLPSVAGVGVGTRR